MLRNGRLYRLIFWVVLFSFSPTWCFSQKAEDLQIVHLKNELSGNSITAIFQDHQGFLWFGTRSGLYRFNGVEFISYECDHHIPGSLPSCYIQTIYEDKDQQLWIGTLEGGLNKYLRDKDQFVSYRPSTQNSNSISSDVIWEIFEDSKDRMWIGTSSGLDLFDPEQGTFQNFQPYSNSESIRKRLVNFVTEDPRGNIWISTRGNGVLKLLENPDNTFDFETNDSLNRKLTDLYIRCGYQGKNGDIWIGTENGLNRLFHDPEKGYQVEAFPEFGYAILAVFEDNQGRVWFGAENTGLFMMDKVTRKVIQFSSQANLPGLSSNSVWSIYEDKVETLWFGTFNNGLNKLDKYHIQFRQFKQLPSGNVSCFYEETTGNIWIGTDGGGLHYWNRSSNTFTAYRHDPDDPESISSDAVLSIMEDRNGLLWIGTWDGLNILDRGTGKFKRYLPDKNSPGSISGNHVSSIIQDRNGLIWIGVFFEGIDIYDPNTKQFRNYRSNAYEENNLCDNQVLKLYEDREGYIWAATEGHGVDRIKWNNGDIVFEHFENTLEDSASISNDIVFSFYEDQKDQMWVGTCGGGLNLFDRDSKKFRALRKRDGLSDDVVNGLLEDNAGNLWINTKKGMTRLDLNTGAIKSYDLTDGQQELTFFRNTGIKTSDGAFLIGGNNGFISFYPENFEENPHLPDVYITGFSIDNKLVRPAEKGPLKTAITEALEIHLSHKQNNFSFEFSALNYSQSDKNQYEFILEGYDKGWQKVGTRRNAYYTKVPPGHYTFKVKGSNNDGRWSDQSASIKVFIAKPWFTTHLALFFYGLIILGVLLWYRNNLLVQERLKSNLKMEHMELEKMQELNQLRSRFFANISHEFRTPLTLILDPLRSIIEGRNKGDKKNQLKIAVRSGERLLRLVNQLLDLSKLGSGSMQLKVNRINLAHFLKPLLESFNSLADQMDIDYVISFEDESLNLYLEEDKLEKIVVNLITNAFKFTPSKGNIQFSVRKKNPEKTLDKNQEGEWVQMEVKDTGIGIDKKSLPFIFDRFYQVEGSKNKAHKGTGIGLSLVKELVEFQKGKIEVCSEEGKGTCFKIYFRLGKSHFSVDEISETPIKGIPTKKANEILISEFEKTTQDTGLPKSTDNAPENNGHTTDLPLVLVVEDSADVRAYIAEYLAQNYRILEAENGKSGWEMALEHIPDLIITDIMMPEMDGIAMCRKIKKEFRTSHIPIVMLTAKAGVDNKAEGFESGADHYVTKPFNSRLLELQIRNILTSQAQLREQWKVDNLIRKEKQESSQESPDDIFLKTALEIIDQNLDNSEFKVESFCRAMGMSRTQLFRKLKAVTGMSPNQFVRKVRLERAAQMLREAQFSVSEVTYKVGFNDLQYFRDCFKQEFGTPPSKFVELEN
ncbi:MAG: response regulator [Bacteroidetes bacterium]|nr:MAG: response regulator [Bacteroidota bacterium]